MNPRLKNKIYIGYIVAVLMLVVVGTLTYLNVDALKEVSNMGNNTHQTINVLNKILHEAKDVQSDARNYIFTENEKHLLLLYQSNEHLLKHHDDLRKLSDRSQGNLQLLDTLSNLIAMRIEFSKVLIHLHKNNAAPEAMNLIRSERGINITEEMGRIIEALIREKISTYNHHLEEEQNRASLIHSAILFGGGLSLLFLFISWFILKVDFTKLQKAEAKLAESENHFRGTFDFAAVGIAHVSLDGKFTRVNKMFCDTTGYSNEEMLSSTFQKITHPDDLARDLDNVKKLLSGEIETYSMEKRYIKKDSSIVWVHLTVSLIYRVAGEPDYFIAFIEDISKRKELEKQILSAMAELKRSNTELEQFAYVASHDLQEPLRMVSSFTQLLAERYKDKLDDRANEFIGYAVNGANRMQRLINDLLDYSRIQTRGKDFHEANASLLLGETFVLLRQKIEESEAIIVNRDLPKIYCDDSQIVRLFQNLIDNAIKFRGEESPIILISAESDGGYWKFSFKDNGIGINPKYNEKIFEIFQRLNNNQHPGTGIGLAVCKRIVERHGGKIWIESNEGEGTTVHFTISKKGKTL